MATTHVLLLVTLVLGLARSSPVPTSKSTTNGRSCNMSRFKSLSPRELEAFKKAKDALEKSLSLKKYSCKFRLFPRDWHPRHLQMWERLMALEAELALTLRVLGSVADSALGDVLDQPLHVLRHIHSLLQACVPAQPQGHLPSWLLQLQEVEKKKSPGCLKAAATFNLFRLLNQNLKCVASEDLCV
ncbi:Interleukin-28B [Tupaia chinensis]|uniref:Interleukin-28B n=1 Tax=Tupaia chinensis TaxID=246437 RepID=L9LBW1_TUPCH|nr:Interleukin-28B [Tupaia chinensis]